eukprot:Pgem_evm1s18719
MDIHHIDIHDHDHDMVNAAVDDHCIANVVNVMVKVVVNDRDIVNLHHDHCIVMEMDIHHIDIHDHDHDM